MSTDQIKELLDADPFVPFTVHVDQKEFKVPHPDYAWLNPGGRVLVVGQSNKEAVQLVDVLLITRITTTISASS